MPQIIGGVGEEWFDAERLAAGSDCLIKVSPPLQSIA